MGNIINGGTYGGMMHCKDVSVCDTDVQLTKENIERMMSDWTSYIRAEGIVLRNGDEHATVSIKKTPSPGLFRKVVEYEISSLPADTVYVEDDTFDVINVPALAKLQSEHHGKTVVIRGMFSHINFIKDLEPQYLTVVDNVPPEPAKLTVLAERALASGFVGMPVVITERRIDMADMLPSVRTEAVMFPCRVSGLTADMPVYFLDDAPVLEHEVTVIGCHLSLRIFQELYGRTPEFINVCPADFTDGTKTIVKCCKVKEGHMIRDNVAKVPWGATVPEVVGAINDLFSDPSEI